MIFMNKSFTITLKQRIQLRRTLHKERSAQNKTVYKQQHNYCVSLLRKTKSSYYAYLNHKLIVDDKEFLEFTPSLSHIASGVC